MDDTPIVVEVSSDIDGARPQLQEACEFGFVGDLYLSNGSVASAVLLGLSRTSLILDRWNGQLHRPAGYPFALALSDIRQIHFL